MILKKDSKQDAVTQPINLCKKKNSKKAQNFLKKKTKFQVAQSSQKLSFFNKLPKISAINGSLPRQVKKLGQTRNNEKQVAVDQNTSIKIDFQDHVIKYLEQ